MTYSEPNSGVDMKGLTIDGDYNLFDPEGKLLVRDYERFASYWMNLYGFEQHAEYREGLPHSFRPINKRAGSSMEFIGKDSVGNWYFNLFGQQVYIYSDEGVVLDTFKYDNTKSHTRPAVHPNGDVYFLDYDEEWVYLYKIPNSWLPSTGNPQLTIP